MRYTKNPRLVATESLITIGQKGKFQGKIVLWCRPPGEDLRYLIGGTVCTNDAMGGSSWKQPELTLLSFCNILTRFPFA